MNQSPLNLDQYTDNGLNLYELLSFLWKKKIVIFLFSFFISSIAAIYSLSIPNSYKSTAIIIPASNLEQSKSPISGFSSLAGIAGVDITPANGAGKFNEAIERIQTFSFFKNHFLPFIKLQDLMAVKSWDSNENILIYEDEFFDQDSDAWVRSLESFRTNKPTAQESYREFLSIFSVMHDEIKDLVYISIEHHSPFIAQEWVNIVIREVNYLMSSLQERESRTAINFLREQINTSPITELKNALSQLVRKETEKLLTLEVNDEYVFRILDYPIASENKYKPRRTLIVILSFLFGCLLSIIYFALVYKLRRDEI